jgi:hypothetical protein
MAIDNGQIRIYYQPYKSKPTKKIYDIIIITERLEDGYRYLSLSHGDIVWEYDYIIEKYTRIIDGT